MSIEKLIQKLTESAEPVKRLVTPEKRAMSCLGVIFLCFIFGLSISGFAGNFKVILHSPYLLIETITLFILVVSSAVGAFLMSVPGRFKPVMFWPIGLSILVWLGLIIYQLCLLLIQNGLKGIIMHYGVFCLGEVIILSILPGLILFIMIRLASPLNLGMTGLLGALAAAGIGALGLQFSCAVIGNPVHEMLWHVLPVMLVAGIGILIGKKWLGNP